MEKVDLEKKRNVSLLNYDLFVMALTHTLIHVFAQIHPALFPVFRLEFGLNLQQLGLIAAMPPLCQTVLTIPSGFLTDKIGSRTILVTCFLTSGLAAIVVSQSVNPLMLTVSISVVILTSTLYHPASYSHVTKIFSGKRRARALGFQGAGGTLGMSLGPISLSLLSGILGWGWRSLYLFWVPPIFLIIFAIWKLSPIQDSQSTGEETERKNLAEDSGNGDGRSLLSASLVLFLVFVAVRMFSESMLSTFIPTYLTDVKGVTVSKASLIYGLVSLTGVVSAPLGGYLADRFGDKRWLMSAIIVNTSCLLTASITPTVLLFVVFYFLSGFFGASGMAANSSIVAKLTPSRQRGMGFALFFLPGSLIGSVAPIVGATVAETLGLIYLFPLSVGTTLVGLALLKFGVKV